MSFDPAPTNINHKKQIMRGGDFLIATERSLSDQLFLLQPGRSSMCCQGTILRRIHLMVFDLQGAELEALRGLVSSECVW